MLKSSKRMGQLLSMSAFSGERWAFNRVLEHSKKSSNELLESQEYLIDVRETDEIRNSGTIPNAINVPLAMVETVLSSPSAFRSKSIRPFPSTSADKLICTCQSGMRASRAAVTAQSLGFENVAVYPGSFSDWSSQFQSK